MPGVKGKGGVKGRSGRKSKAEELGLIALLDECWTLDARRDCIRKLAEKASQGEFEAVKILMGYTYGKPVDRKEITGAGGADLLQPIADALNQVYGDAD